ncbi:MAG: 16S rRNA (guanine(966)-N(2))-methyltransferase RsmD [Lachnospiraceae bacterium]|nr:16S rRNA (guanine(966)-N(2))-methyltransferase RsmD [Lachnospiraceae bacterium]
MRVIAGTARSLQLVTPTGLGTRPTTDRIRETLFNVMQTDVPGSVFVDLFAGSGACGIEALSRGAKKAYFIENAKDALACIEQNVKHCKFEAESMILKQDAIEALKYTIRETVDIIFADPPYEKGYDRLILEAGATAKCIGEYTLIVIEEAKDTDFSYADSLGYDIIKEKIYKTNKHVFLRRK